MEAIGVHVFAGGFTMGVKRVCNVKAQMELHNFGLDTARQIVDVCNCERWEDWPVHNVEFTYGNPRCTGFSCITSGYGEDTHGPWAKQTKDVHDFCHYSIATGADIIIWESVQQAYSTGRLLLDYLRDELFVPAGYRIAHVFVNAATFGNAQNRRRYFFVAYRNNRNFNVTPPDIQDHGTFANTIGCHLHRKTTAKNYLSRNAEYDEDTCLELLPDEVAILPHMKEGEHMNGWARDNEDLLEAIAPHYFEVWLRRGSMMPFSLHCIQRPKWSGHCPTLHSSCSRIIHPIHNRTLTVLELSTIMGWDMIPRGWWPQAQLAKGVVPAVGQWLAEQAKAYVDDVWGNDDWNTKYSKQTGVWEGERCDGDVEKVIDMTQYFKGVPKCTLQ